MTDYWPDVVSRCADMPLFNQPAPAQQHSRTSMKAADSLSPKTLNAMQRRVYEFLASRPDGATDEEMQTALGINPSTQRPRRIELVRRGLVVEDGTRRTSSGRAASVWKATAASR